MQLVSDFLEFVHRQDKSAQENGVWIVTTHPDAYSEVEQRFMEDVKTACRREKITLFVARASDLPDGWHKIE